MVIPAVALLLVVACGPSRESRPTATPGAVVAGEPAARPGAQSELDPATLTAGPPRAVDGRYLFTLHEPGARTVAIAGTFNGWLPAAHPMQRHGDLWFTLIDLPFGRHAYRFLIDGTRWVEDPDNPRRGGDGMGGTASILDVR